MQFQTIMHLSDVYLFYDFIDFSIRINK